MEHTILNQSVSAEDLQLYRIYFEKHRAVGENLLSWLRIGLATNSALLAIVAFLLRPPGSNGPVSFPTSWTGLIAIGIVSFLGFLFCARWVLAYGDMVWWQLRTNAVLASAERQLIQPQFLIPWEEAGQNKQHLSLGKCGMWNMINAYEPPNRERAASRPMRDVADRMTQLPRLFTYLWISVLVLDIISAFV